MKRILLLLFLGACAFAGGSAVMLMPFQIPSRAFAQVQYTKPAADPNQVLQVGNLFERTAARVGPAVVAVDSSYPSRRQDPASGRKKIIEESGSGFIVTFPGRNGYYVLTNNHVVAYARPDQITIRLADGRIFRPVRVWADPETDIAVLGLSKQAGRPPTIALGNSATARPGQWVLAIGSPFGLNQTVTHGIISARERGEVRLGNTIRIKDFLQTDAAINPGSSGGPLINLNGQAIGINTAIASHSGTNSGVAFSIPINLVKRVANQLLANGTVARGYLGMQLAESFEAQDALRLGLDRVQGAWVERVYPGTPAADAGLKVNDVVLRVGDMVIRNENHLINLISKMPSGQRVTLLVWRGRRTMQLSATVGDWNEAQRRFQTQ